MNNKNKIYFGIAVVAIIAIGYFIFSGSSATPQANPVADSSTPASPIVNILPLGNTFDTSVIKKLKSQFNIFTYPKVTQDAIGVSLSSLIKTTSDTPPKQ